jgi:hypothetical protein
MLSFFLEAMKIILYLKYETWFMRMAKEYGVFIVLFLSIVCQFSGILEFNIAHIRAHELKQNIFNADKYYIAGDPFSIQETVSHMSYDDAFISLTFDKEKYLKDKFKDQIQHLSFSNLDFWIPNGEYDIKPCIDIENIHIIDSTLFLHISKIVVLGSIEIYSRKDGKLVYTNPSKKISIKNKVLFHGLTSHKYIRLKSKEIWMNQLYIMANDYLKQFEERGEMAYEYSRNRVHQSEETPLLAPSSPINRQ